MQVVQLRHDFVVRAPQHVEVFTFSGSAQFVARLPLVLVGERHAVVRIVAEELVAHLAQGRTLRVSVEFSACQDEVEPADSRPLFALARVLVQVGEVRPEVVSEDG